MNILSKLSIGFLIISALAGLSGYIGLHQLEEVSGLITDEVASSIDQYQNASAIDGLIETVLDRV